ncbi:MAG: ATPase, T2SS/T4P/T4SS family, partial [Nanoarchaeota archaeon]
AMRRHRDNPWTLPLFIKKKMMNALCACLLSFLVDGGRTFLIAGTRSSGKTSILGSLIAEIMKKTRIISVEDTLEIPVSAYRKIGYNIQPMKVRSALTSQTSELSAEEGVSTSLRMGDSALIVGEIRSKEALALYEAMSVGALANIVA